METTPKSRPWFAILPVLLLFVMLLAPSMRRPMVAQFKLVFRPILNLVFHVPDAYAWALREQGVKGEELPESDPAEEQAAIKNLAASNPQDYQIRLAYSLLEEWSHVQNTPDDRVTRLDALAGVFPSRATVYAHMLRYETEREVKVRRSKEYQLLVQQIPTEEVKIDPDEVRPPPDKDKSLEKFEEYAVAGEKLEPDNAYFSMMRAVGLFAKGDDDALAVACIVSAASKRQWEDHVADELEADWKLGSLAFNDKGAALRSVIQGSVSSPHLDQLAAVGRTAAAVAIKLEKEHHAEQGIALRIAMAHCGATMRAHAHSIPGAITGAAITYEQIYRPGGAPLIEPDVNFSNAEREQQRLDAYFNYLKKYNRADEANWMRNELKTDAMVKEIQSGAATASLSPYGRHGLRVTSWWMLDCVLLTNILYVLIPVLLVLPLMLRKKAKAALIVLVLVGAYIIALALASITQWAQAFTAVRSVFNLWIVHNGGLGADSKVATMTDRVFDPGSLHAVVVVLSMLAPLFLFALLYIKSRRSNIIFIDMIKLDFVQFGAILTCAMLLVYGYTLTKTSQHETQLHSELDQVMINEGRYEAPMIGKQWPE